MKKGPVAIIAHMGNYYIIASQCVDRDEINLEDRGNLHWKVLTACNFDNQSNIHWAVFDRVESSWSFSLHGQELGKMAILDWRNWQLASWAP